MWSSWSRNYGNLKESTNSWANVYTTPSPITHTNTHTLLFQSPVWGVSLCPPLVLICFCEAVCQGVGCQAQGSGGQMRTGAKLCLVKLHRVPQEAADQTPAWLQPLKPHHFVQRRHSCNYNPNPESITHCVNHPQKIAFSFSISITHNCTLYGS